MKRVVKHRRREGKTDYRAREKLLGGRFPRVVLRISNKYFTGQLIESVEAKDSVKIGLSSKALLNYGWPKEKSGGLKSKVAGYLTG